MELASKKLKICIVVTAMGCDWLWDETMDSHIIFPTPEDLPDPGIELASLESSVLAGKFFTCSATA